MPDPFASGPIALTLAWLVTAGSLFAAAGKLIGFLLEKGDMARPFKLWFVLCFFLLSPARYIFFLLIAGETFAVQSIGAFFNAMVLVFYVPIVFGLLCLIGAVLPAILTLVVLGDEERRDTGRYIGATVVLPVACFVGSWLFILALPYAAKTVRWLPAAQVIKATNGPAAFVFDYITRPYSPIYPPPYFEFTPRDRVAFRRCHVAALYLSAQGEAKFYKTAYPDVYKRFTAE